MTTMMQFIENNPGANPRNKKEIDPDGRAVIYWMQRAQRVRDNPALELAVTIANALKKPLIVFFNLIGDYPGANLRHYAFMLEGLAETSRELEQRGARFVLRIGRRNDLARFCADFHACAVVGDENPLREAEWWRQKQVKRLKVAFVTVDGDVIVPSRLFPKEEYAARTFRPKIHRLLGEYLVPPARWRLNHPRRLKVRSDWTNHEILLKNLKIDRSVSPVSGAVSGPSAARRRLNHFVKKQLAHYDERRNKPEFADGTSGLSAFLHFGQIGPREVAFAVQNSRAPRPAIDAFLEEFIVRRELSINYVLRNPHYDTIEGLHPWAQQTLAEHARDKRAYCYTSRQLECAETHDPLWNAAQEEMLASGRMHGYIRMYWAKKILEWTRSPEEALSEAIRLNDRYFLDGRDPNGYTGIAWAIGGKHDRAWPERPIFGKIRFMSFASTSKKFDCAAYIARVEQLQHGK